MDLRDLPSVDALAQQLHRELEPRVLPDALVTALAREAIDAARTALIDGAQTADPMQLALPGAAQLAGARPTRVINATGVLLHTNLGRAPLAPAAVDASARVGAGYANVEFDLTTGARGGRGAYLDRLLQSVTGAEAGLAVNNNAGALLLSLAAIAGSGGAVAVSRGELIEIGGSFRLPSLMKVSGAQLVEVGTTNRTRRSDFEADIERVDAVLKVHPSNYRIEGFAEDVGYATLGDLAHRHDVALIADVGSGLLDTRVPWIAGPPPSWLADEPGVRQTLDAGADVVLFSGDKLLGGPQAGIAVGRRDLIEEMSRHPLARALRVDGATHAMLGATLEAYAGGTADQLPFWKMAMLDFEELRARHASVLEAAGIAGDVIESESVPGAGSVPGETIPSPAIRLPGRGDGAWKSLVASNPPIVGRRRDDALLLDLRTVEPADDGVIADALTRLGA